MSSTQSQPSIATDRTDRTVRYVDFPAQYAEERDEIHAVVDAVFATGEFVGGKAVDEFESAVAQRLGCAEAVALNSGTDALMFAMVAHGIGRGDEVITPPNSFVASTASIVHIGATPVFADVLPDQNVDPAAVEAAITPRTKAIMPVHLTGRMAQMDTLRQIASSHGLVLIEDAAQAFGSLYNGRPAGNAGDIGCFSAHPLKNLNAAGDAGFITLNDSAIATRLRRLRSHGLRDRETVGEFGFVSRMDTLQAALLIMRLRHVDDVVSRRRANAAHYRARLQGLNAIFIPPCRNEEFNTFHTFVVQVDRRDALKEYLAARGIQTAIHYPVPIHLQPAAAGLGCKAGQFPVTEQQAARIITLPVHQFLALGDIDYVCEAIHDFYSK